MLATGSLQGGPIKLPESKVVYEKDSAYHQISILEDGLNRYLRFNRSFQGGMVLKDAFESPFLYTSYAHLAWIFNPAIKRMLVVGLGSGSIPKRFTRDYADVTVDTVELDPAVVDVAKRFFDVKEDARQRITVQDGRVFLRRAEAKYDLIILDAYFAEGIPFHLATKEFLEIVRDHLAPGGVVVSNIIGAMEGANSYLFRALYRTYNALFPGLYPFPVAFGLARIATENRTIILVSTGPRRNRWRRNPCHGGPAACKRKSATHGGPLCERLLRPPCGGRRRADADRRLLPGGHSPRVRLAARADQVRAARHVRPTVYLPDRACFPGRGRGRGRRLQAAPGPGELEARPAVHAYGRAFGPAPLVCGSPAPV